MEVHETHHYHLPIRPYSPIDSLNRRAAAIGSVRTVALTSHANYNGHHVHTSWNDYRSYYVTEYTWAGRVVLARGEADRCTAAAIAEYDKGALGASVHIALRGVDVDHVLSLYPQLRPGADEGDRPWYTWRHQCAAEAARDAANPRIPVMVFDWDLMQACSDRAEYERALKAKHGRIYT
jgi:hypothetical protein